MSGAEMAEYLTRRRYLVVSTARKDGRPHAALSAFVLGNERFWLPTMVGTARERNVRVSRYVSLVVAEGDSADHKAVLSEGPAEVASDVEEAVVDIWNSRHGELPDWADAWITVTPAKLFSYDARAPEHHLMGWTCETCGDTFMAHGSVDSVVCRSCGGSDVRPAAEPFL